MFSRARIATFVAFAVIAAVALFALVDRSALGSPSATFVPDGPASNNRFLVTKAPATSPLHRGDRIEIGDPRDLAAYEYHSLVAGSFIGVRRIAPLPAVTLAEPIVRQPGKLGIFAPIVVAIEAMFIGIAAVIAARGRSAGSLSLAWFFALLVLLFNPTTPAWPGWLLLAFAMVEGAIAVAALLCVTDFATRFAGDPNSSWARRVRGVSGVIGCASTVIVVGVSSLSFFSVTMPKVLDDLPTVVLVAQVGCALVALAIAFARAPAAERQRVSWVAASLGVGVVGLLAAIVAEGAGVARPLREYPLLLVLAMPLGCAYAILRYRLLDIAFVINRATVFGITSLVVLAALALVDYGLQTLLGSWLLHTGLYVQLALALVIGISTRPLHERVDHFVDDVFFRRRHEAERALRQFARDVVYIDDTNVVLERTVETVARTANLSCAVFMATTDGLLNVATSGTTVGAQSVDRNDAAVVRLRATRGAVDLHDVATAFAGDYAFPMFARNRLIGLLVCAGKTAGAAAYAPDELDAIAAVAQAAGLALDLLRIEALERELDGFRATVPFAAAVRRV